MPVPSMPAPLPDPYDVGACMIHGTSTVVGMLTTANRYFGGIVTFAERISDVTPCVVTAITDQVTERSPRVRTVTRQIWNSYRPERIFCEGGEPEGWHTAWSDDHPTGWRHAHILKAGLVDVILGAGRDLLIADADWTPIPGASVSVSSMLMRLNSLNWDVATFTNGWGYNRARSPFHGSCGRMINIGLMWMRSTPETRHLAVRFVNRTFGAWDQAIFNQEIEAAQRVRCCNMEHLMHGTFSHNHGRRMAEGHGRKMEECGSRLPLGDALPPPAACQGADCGNIYTNWDPRGYNQDWGSVDIRCLAVPCDGVSIPSDHPCEAQTG